MSRIFFSLATISLLLMGATFVIGWIGGDYNALSNELRDAQRQIVEKGRDNPDAKAELDRVLTAVEPVKKHVQIHILIGVLAALVNVLVQSIGVTYFIGTGRWCKEVVDAYGLDDQWVVRSNALKRRSFPFAMLGMGIIIMIVAFGAAADPGTLRETTGAWVQPHLWSGAIGMLLMIVALWRQGVSIRDNQRLIDEIVQCVRAERSARGLEV